MVSEFCDQGDLYDKMNKLFWMNQIVVKFLMEQILNAVAYLHSKGVFHGDIKLENIMLYTTTKYANERFTLISKQLSYDKTLEKEIDNSYRSGSELNGPTSKSLNIINDMLNYEIKLIDFGCSKIFSKRGERKSGIIGTSIYCSPEVIDDLYDEKCDEWSCGVLMYLLLCGEPPFQGETDEEIFKKVKKCEFDFSPPQFKKVSKNCKDLIKKLLEPKISRTTLHTKPRGTTLLAGTKLPWLGSQTIHPYSDYLLHDMGSEIMGVGLNDNFVSGLARGNEWRTTPLWGIGLQQKVNGHTYFLHDGRARNFIEAIMWHGGEGEASKNKFKNMPKKQRDQLVKFLWSL